MSFRARVPREKAGDTVGFLPKSFLYKTGFIEVCFVILRVYHLCSHYLFWRCVFMSINSSFVLVGCPFISLVGVVTLDNFFTFSIISMNCITSTFSGLASVSVSLLRLP